MVPRLVLLGPTVSRVHLVLSRLGRCNMATLPRVFDLPPAKVPDLLQTIPKPSIKSFATCSQATALEADRTVNSLAVSSSLPRLRKFPNPQRLTWCLERSLSCSPGVSRDRCPLFRMCTLASVSQPRLSPPMELGAVAPEAEVEADQVLAAAVLPEVVGGIQARAILLRPTLPRAVRARVARNHLEGMYQSDCKAG